MKSHQAKITELEQAISQLSTKVKDLNDEIQQNTSDKDSALQEIENINNMVRTLQVEIQNLKDSNEIIT